MTQWILLLHLQNLQDMDEKRIARIQEFIRQTANIERNVIPIINACIDGMVKAADSIDSSQVCYFS